MGLYDALFEHIDVGPVTIPNRIVRSPHGTGLSGEGLIAYHEARARGGVGMSTIEATGVHESAPIGLPLYHDRCMPFLEEIAGRVRPHGMKLFLQAYHPGAGYGEAMGAPEHWSASAVPNPMAGVVPIAMTQTMIDEVVESFGAAARRCRDAGLDGIEIHASSGYLIHEFLSPALNKREDRYGRSAQNRMRFLLEIIQAVREAVGDSAFAVGVRIPNEDYVPGGLTAEHNAEIARTIDPLVDYVSLHMGAYWRFHKLIAPSDDPLSTEMPANRSILPAITKPSIVVGRIMTLADANHIVAGGEADMVSMVRALIADPELVNKARRGDDHEIRPCIGSNMGCVGQLMSGRPMSCVVNVAAAKESRLALDPTAPAATRKRILVVGGGPAGLEFARTAALRGHEVVLHEATGALGGQVRLAARAPHRGDLGEITRWLARQLETLGVETHCNSLVDVDVVEAAGADEVVLATGTMPRSDGFQLLTPAVPVPGTDLPHVHTSWDLFGYGETVALDAPAVVYDDTGTFEAISAAEVLLESGLPLTMVSRVDAPGANVPYPPVTVGAARERLYGGDFDFIGGHSIRAINADTIEIGVPFTDRKRTLPARTVVFVGFNEPNRALGEALTAKGIRTESIGDVQGRNSIMSAIHSGAHLGRSI